MCPPGCHHNAGPPREIVGPRAKFFSGAPTTSFFPNCRKTTQGRQYSKALQKTLMKNLLNFKHYRHNINTANIIIIIIILYNNFIGPLPRFGALISN